MSELLDKEISVLSKKYRLAFGVVREIMFDVLSATVDKSAIRHIDASLRRRKISVQRIENIRADCEKVSARLLEKCLGTGNEKYPIVLILDKALQRLPWESMPILQDQPVSRMPNVFFLQESLSRYGDPQVSANKGFFILDPSDEFSKTVARFKPRLSQLQKSSGWHGFIGKKELPSHPKWTESLSQSNIFLYFGHSGGEQYIDPECIERTSSQAIVFLMGCSSGHVSSQGEYGPAGIALSYLIAGCPAVVSNLWGVTSEDIDSFTFTFLDSWIPDFSPAASSPPLPSADESVPLLVASSRRLPSADELLRVASCHQLPFASDSFQLLDDSFHHQLRLLLKKKKIEAYHMCHRSEQ